MGYNIEVEDSETILWPATLMETLNFENNVIESVIGNFLINPKETTKLFTEIRKEIKMSQTSDIYNSIDSKKSISEIL